MIVHCPSSARCPSLHCHRPAWPGILSRLAVRSLREWTRSRCWEWRQPQGEPSGPTVDDHPFLKIPLLVAPPPPASQTEGQLHTVVDVRVIGSWPVRHQYIMS